MLRRKAHREEGSEFSFFWVEMEGRELVSDTMYKIW